MIIKHPFRVLLFSAVITLISLGHALAQQAAQINYQAVARRADGNPVASQMVTLRLSIKEGSATGATVYSEIRQTTTNNFGLFNVVIGSSGTVSNSGTVASVNWASGNKYLQVEIDPQGGNNFLALGTSQLQSVPYAIYANNAAPIGTASGDLSGTYPNPTVSKIQGKAISSTAPLSGQILQWNGTAWEPSNVAGVAGSQGPAGAIGPQGPIGLTGPQGLAGIDGLVGPAGPTGPTGAIGPQGDVGPQGLAGLDGTTLPDATSASAGKIQLAGDLAGTNSTAAAPRISSNAIITDKIADLNVTDAKIAGLSGSKVNGNIAGNATNVTGTVTLANGGTGAISAAEARTNLGVEALSNKSTAVDLGSTLTSDDKYPSQKAVKTYVDAQTGAAGVSDGSITNAKLAGSIAASKLIGTDITTVGTINEGTWNGTTVAVANGGTGASTLTGYVKGNGTNSLTASATIPAADISGLIKKVNGSTPDSDGNVAVAFGTVSTGTLANRPTNAGTNGNIYVVSGDINTSDNGRTYISDGTGWNEVTSNQSATDARYLQLAGGTLAGSLTIPTTKVLTITDAPSNNTDAANKSYVDAAISNSTIADATSSSAGKIQLAGDLAGVGSSASTPKVGSVGGSAAALINSAEVLANAAVSANTANQLVKRDGSGNFSAGMITANLTGNVAGNITGNASGTASNVTGTVDVANGGSGATSLTGYLIGNGTSAFSSSTSIPASAITGLIKKVNGSTPDSDGNVAVAFGTVSTGTLANRPINAGTNGNIYVVSADATTAENGRTFISDGTNWKEVTSNQAATDARYLQLAGGILAGSLTIPTAKVLTITDAPFNNTDATNKSYVDAAISNSTIEDATSLSAGKIQLAGDLAGSGTSAATPRVASVGGSTAALINSAELLANSSTSVNSVNQLVKRDGNGDFSARIISANLMGSVTGNATNVTGVIAGSNGGTGVANTGKTITIGGNLETLHALKFTTSGATNLTLPTSGTLATVQELDAKEVLSNKSTEVDLGSTLTSDDKYPSQKAVKSYVDAQTAAAGVSDGSITNAKLAGSIAASKLIGTDITKVGTITEGIWNGTTVAVANGGTGATSLSGYVKGNGTNSLTASATIPAADISGLIKKVNGSTPDSDGNVAVAFGTVSTGTLTDRPTIAGTNGNIYVVSGDTNTPNNGRTYISDGTGWNEVTSNQAATDARYLQLAGGTLAGSLTIPASKVLTITDAPSNITDATNKSYVDAAIANSTIADATSSSAGKIQLAGDLVGVGSSASSPKVGSVGGSTAALINSAEVLANAAVSANTVNQIVKRDASGNFDANIITANLTGNVTGNITGNVSGTASNLTGTVAVANGGSGATSLTGYLIGNGTSAFSSSAYIPASAVTGLIKKVNGSTPDSDGNVAVAFGTVSTGTLATRPINAGTNGNIYVVSGDATTAENGRTFISDGTNWKEVTSNQSATDARYLQLAGGTLAGNIVIPTTKKITLTDAPTASTDAVNKAYVDASTASASVDDATTSALGKIQLGGDLAGSGTSAATPRVASVGGSTATLINSAELLANASTSANTVNQLVKRDGNGDFSARTISSNLTGNVTGTATNVTGLVAGANGGTGVANTNKTIKIGGNFETGPVSGVGHAVKFTTTGTTDITLPTGGTLATLAQVDAKELNSNKSMDVTLGSSNNPSTLGDTKFPTQNAVKAYVSNANSTNANLTGPITSVGNTTSVALQTGTGSKFVMDTSPTLVTPNLGTPSAVVLTNATALPLTTGVAGALPIANGGTGATTAATAMANLIGLQSANTFMAGSTSPIVTISAFDGSSLTGWTNSGGTSIDGSSGNPGSAYKTVGPNQSFYRDFGQSLKNKIIEFDIKLTSGVAGFSIGGNLGLKIASGTNSINGIAGQNSWSYPNSSNNTFTFSPGTWYAIKIVTDNGAAGGTSWYVNGVLIGNSGGYAMGDGSLFGILTDGATAYYDNIVIKEISNVGAVPSFRTLVAADIPTLNQSTTGTASNVSGTVAVANGGTGTTTLTGLVKGNGNGAMTGAVAGTDYLAPTGSAASLTNFPILNQNTTGTASNITGTVAVVNGGTGATNAAVARTNLGVEALSNKSTAIDLGNTSTSDDKYPSQKAVKVYVDASIASVSIADATTSALGKIKLGGDLAGSGTSAATPRVASVGGSTATLINSAEVLANASTSANTANQIVKRDVNGDFSARTISANLTGTVTGNATNVTGVITGANGGTGVDNTGKTITIGGNFETLHALKFTTAGSTNLTLPISGTLATVQQLDAKELISNKSSDVNLGTSVDKFPTQSAVKSYVDTKTVNLSTTQTVGGLKTFSDKLTVSSGTAGGAVLEVNGASTNTTAYNAVSAITIDFTKSNLAYTSASAGSFSLTGIKDGGTYTLAVQGATAGTSSFSQTGFTFKNINNGATTASKHTLYTFIVMGTTVYYSMMTGL